MSIVNGTMQRVMEFNERLMDRKIPKPTGTLSTKDFAWMAPIEARWEEVAAEVDALIALGVKLPEVEYVAGFDQGNEGSWSTYTLHTYGTWLEHQCARCPVTTELVRDIPGLQVAGFSVLGPQSHLPRHRGPNRGALRYQIGLRVPGEPGEARIQVGDTLHVWSEGASLVFDHSVHHEAWNDSDGYRYLLFIEFVWPVPGITGGPSTGRSSGCSPRQPPGSQTASKSSTPPSIADGVGHLAAPGGGAERVQVRPAQTRRRGPRRSAGHPPRGGRVNRGAWSGRRR